MKRVKEKICIRPSGGLGNRMRFLLSMLYYQEKYDFTMRIAWRQDPACNVRFEELFEPIEGIEVYNYIKMGYKNPMWSLKSIKGMLYEIYLKIKYNNYIESREITNLFRLKGEKDVQETLLKEKVCCLIEGTQPVCYERNLIYGKNRLMPSKDILIRVNSIMEKYDKGHLIGVHIRRTDHKEAIKRSPLELFVKKMEEKQKEEDIIFFLATDDNTVKRELLNRNFTVVTSDKLTRRDTSSGMIEAFVDMLCLSMCREIWGSFGSTFSWMAAYWGGIPLEIISTDESK